MTNFSSTNFIVKFLLADTLSKSILNNLTLSLSAQSFHYEKTPIQINWKFYNQKERENFQIKKILIFFIFFLKT